MSGKLKWTVTPGFPPDTPEQERSMRRDRYPPRFDAETLSSAEEESLRERADLMHRPAES